MSEITERSAKEEIEAIKAENLSGRQLRLARRLAQRQGIEARSDLDAVRLLRKAGIEPFSVPDPGGSEAPSGNVPMQGGGGMSAPPARIDPEQRELSIRKIQQNLVRRRKRRIFASLAKIVIFVVLPTNIAGYYFSQMATPIFASHSKFVVQKGAGAASAGGRAAAAGGAFANVSESISVQNYIESRSVMLRLDDDYGFRELFQDPLVDPLQRLAPDASNEEAYKLYSKRVKLSYDPTEGVIGLEVSTPDPQASFEISNILRDYAEAHVRGMTARSKTDQISGAEQTLEDAEENLRSAQEAVLRLQSDLGVLNGETEISFLMNEIASLETQRLAIDLDLQELQSNPRPNAARVATMQGQIDRLDAQIAERRASLIAGGDDSASLARVQSELNSAQMELQLRQQIVASSVQNLEAARLAADQASIYLNRAVDPIISDQKSYPKVFENTLLSFLVFAGIYLLVTLTFSILREQMTT
ncbi:MAG: capsule biosynthesis protein [Pseudomonadota bacterium]